MFSLLLVILPFPKRDDSILLANQDHVQVSASGTLGQYYERKCHPTHPEYLIDSVERKMDWCSNINKTKDDKPWLTLSLKGKGMNLKGYGIRAGCCYYACCCLNDEDVLYSCCCDLYSWALQGSHDNVTWTELHRVEKDKEFYDCRNRVYDIKTTEYFEYVRLIQIEPWPGCNYCMCVNKLELYGTTSDRELIDAPDDGDDSVSIIGKVKHDYE